MKGLAAIIAVAVFAFAVFAVALPVSAASRHHRQRNLMDRAGTAQPQIACTMAGCLPVPRGCHPEMGYTPGGTPTGFDVAVCGNYTLYGNRR